MNNGKTIMNKPTTPRPIIFWEYSEFQTNPAKMLPSDNIVKRMMMFFNFNILGKIN